MVKLNIVGAMSYRTWFSYKFYPHNFIDDRYVQQCTIQQKQLVSFLEKGLDTIAGKSPKTDPLVQDFVTSISRELNDERKILDWLQNYSLES